jgi:DNA mismatch endonuclease (patch repair protein)
MTKEQRHKCMSNIKSKDTSVEITLRKALWHEGIRYRKNFKTLPGKPDIAITKYKVAVFCDGELWHGKDWTQKKTTFKTNRDYWVSKIEKNIARDMANERKLEKMGWVVLRFWGMEIEKNLKNCVNEVKEKLYEIKNGIYQIDYYHEDYYAAENENDYS